MDEFFFSVSDLLQLPPSSLSVDSLQIAAPSPSSSSTPRRLLAAVVNDTDVAVVSSAWGAGSQLCDSSGSALPWAGGCGNACWVQAADGAWKRCSSWRVLLQLLAAPAFVACPFSLPRRQKFLTRFVERHLQAVTSL